MTAHRHASRSPSAGSERSAREFGAGVILFECDACSRSFKASSPPAFIRSRGGRGNRRRSPISRDRASTRPNRRPRDRDDRATRPADRRREPAAASASTITKPARTRGVHAMTEDVRPDRGHGAAGAVGSPQLTVWSSRDSTRCRRPLPRVSSNGVAYRMHDHRQTCDGLQSVQPPVRRPDIPAVTRATAGWATTGPGEPGRVPSTASPINRRDGLARGGRNPQARSDADQDVDHHGGEARCDVESALQLSPSTTSTTSCTARSPAGPSSSAEAPRPRRDELRAVGRARRRALIVDSGHVRKDADRRLDVVAIDLLARRASSWRCPSPCPPWARP